MFVSAIRDPGKATGTLRLILALLAREDVGLVGDSVLVREYARYAEALPSPAAARLAATILSEMRVVEPEERHVQACRPYFADAQTADCVHAATCHQTGALLISSDRHFDRVARAGLVTFLRTSEAVRRFAPE